MNFLWTEGRTFETHFIRSTKSRPKTTIIRAFYREIDHCINGGEDRGAARSAEDQCVSD